MAIAVATLTTLESYALWYPFYLIWYQSTLARLRPCQWDNFMKLPAGEYAFSELATARP